jgi:hypothetical protein
VHQHEVMVFTKYFVVTVSLQIIDQNYVALTESKGNEASLCVAMAGSASCRIK